MTRRTLGTGPHPTTTPEPAALRGRLPAEHAAPAPAPEDPAAPRSTGRRALGTGTPRDGR
ncbi:hypothetical protein ACIBEA_41850 [Streptomyces sp. NPDC051555]|uniref:hypothetical protein n=1 Tax=Streptomyces sp. NPDC051555 TaxID=3365657 RepID=UPI0037B51901